jgi:hypothetical protein
LEGEIKFPQNELNRYSLENPITVGLKRDPKSRINPKPFLTLVTFKPQDRVT